MSDAPYSMYDAPYSMSNAPYLMSNDSVAPCLMPHICCLQVFFEKMQDAQLEIRLTVTVNTSDLTQRPPDDSITTADKPRGTKHGE